jgi:fructokinase
VETYISGGGLQNRYAEAFGRRRALENIVADYRAADPPTAGFMREFFRNFGRALANVINILDPDIVVLGGGVSNVDELYTEGVREVARCVFSDSLETPIVRHELGDSAGVIGAALIGV